MLLRFGFSKILPNKIFLALILKRKSCICCRPANVENILSIIKVNIGLTWVGVIVGEFLVSREGIGYLVVYGGQVFKLDLVMMGVFILALIALIMYEIINLIEFILKKSKNKTHKK